MSYKKTAEEWLNSAYSNGSFGTIYVDIDRLMLHNDCFGHVHGDETIDRVSKCLQDNLQKEDAKFLRVGGEEFIIVVQGANVQLTFELAEKMRLSIECLKINLFDEDYQIKYFNVPTLNIVTVSIGAMIFETRENKPILGAGSWIFEMAQNAMFYSKLAGRNKVVNIDLR